MNRILTSAIALAVLCIVQPTQTLHAQAAGAVTSPQDQASAILQGTWEGEEKDRESEGKCTMTVKDNTLHFQGAKPQEWYKGTFKLPAGTTPQQLEGTITECGNPDFVGKPAVAIFKIEGDTLTIVGQRPGIAEAPKSFDGGDETRTFVLKKVQK
jgi:uncharacterized protein (TIGR03067 family)